MSWGLKPWYIVHTIRSAVHDGEELPKSERLDATISKVGLNLLHSVRKSVEYTDPIDEKEPEWREEVLEPIIEDFEVPEDFLQQDDEAEFIILQSLIVFMSYEILRQRGTMMNVADEEFVIAMFGEFVTEQSVREKILHAVNSEHERLASKDADMRTLNAMFMLGGLITAAPPPTDKREKAPKLKAKENTGIAKVEEVKEKTNKAKDNKKHGEKCTPKLDDIVEAEEEKDLEECDITSVIEEMSAYIGALELEKADAKYAEAKEILNARKGSLRSGSDSSEAISSSSLLASSGVLSDDDNVKFLPDEATNIRDVHVQIFLKKEKGYEFDFARSREEKNKMVKAISCLGITMIAEESVDTSPISGRLDTIRIENPRGSGYDLSATVIIPPGYCYSMYDVISVIGKSEAEGWIELETPQAWIFVGNGAYDLLPITHGRITIQNVNSWL